VFRRELERMQKHQIIRKGLKNVAEVNPIHLVPKKGKDKSLSLQKPTPKEPSSKTLIKGSTGKDIHVKPFWTKSSKEWSQNLWLHSRSDCVSLDFISGIQCSTLGTQLACNELDIRNKCWQPK